MHASKTDFGQLGSSVSSAVKSEFFTFFHLNEAGSAAAGETTRITYKPEAPEFRKLVTVYLTVDSRQRILGAQLEIDRGFIVDPQNGVFARDIAKSFVLACASDPTKHKAVSDTAAAIYRPSKEKLNTSEGLRVYAGIQESCSIPISEGQLHMRNVVRGPEQWLVMTASKGSDRETEQESDHADRREAIGRFLEEFRNATSWGQRLKLCHEVLKLTEPSEDGELRATIQAMRGEALVQSKEGDRKKNLEEAITAYQEFLKSNTPKTDKINWARVTLALAEVYRERTRANGSGDLEDVIACEEQVLEVTGKDFSPADWAEVSARVAADYLSGNKSGTKENRLKAMQHYANALEVWEPQTYGTKGREAALKIAELSEDVEDKGAKKFKNRAISWLESFVEYLRRQTNPEEREAAKEELRAALGAVPADPRPDLQHASQRIFPFLMLSETLALLARLYIVGDRDGAGKHEGRAIAALEEAIAQIPADAMADVWASRAMSLANLYRDWGQGERSRNFELAFELYEQAITGPIRFIDPKLWVSLLLNFSDAYELRKETRDERLERLITWLQTALELPALREDIQQLAPVNVALGHVYSVLPTGDRAAHLEQAIGFYKSALSGLGERGDRVRRATVLDNLGVAFARRTRGDPVENIEEAIGYFNGALQLWDPKAQAGKWAGDMMNLGIAYSHRRREDPATNHERSLECYRQSLKVITKESNPIVWATVKHNIGTTYLRARDNDPENVERAKAAYEDVLTVRTPENVPNDWAATMTNLGNAYLNRTKDDPTVNYENGIECCNAALTVRTREENPYEWAETLNHLGNLHHRLYEIEHRSPGKSWTGHFEGARKAYSDALQVSTPEADAKACLPLALSLANLYVAEAKWKEAVAPFRTAIQAAENVYQASILGTTREVQLENIGDLYRRAANAFTHAGEDKDAVCTLERGRARGLNEALALNRADLSRVESQSPEAFAAYRDAAVRLRRVAEMDRTLAGRADLLNSMSLEREQLRREAQNARQELDSALGRIRQIAGLENFLLPVTWEEICEQVEPGAPLVYVAASHEATFTALLVRKSPEQQVQLETWFNPDFGERHLQLMLEDLNENAMGWISAYMQRNQSPTGWKAALERVCSELWKPIMRPIMEKIRDSGADQVIFIPCGLFAFLPLHAAWTEESGERVYATDVAAFRYAPSASVLAAARRIAAITTPDSLLAVAEPSPVRTGCLLPNADGEVEPIAALFVTKTVMSHSEATHNGVLRALPAAKVAHFACHGRTDWQEPLRSSLLMANDEPLTVSDLLDLHLDRARLTVLSACETAIVGTRLPDEVVALSSALLQAGFAGVIASMWSVFDLSTALLMPRIYQLWIRDGVAPHQALQQAILWLRSQTAADFAKLFEVARAQAVNSGAYEQTSDSWQHFAYDYAPDERPYSHPAYWAAFTYTGV